MTKHNYVRFQMLKDKGIIPEKAYTSVLKWAIKTLFYIQDTMDLHWIPVVRDYRLNERMYGGLTGMDKSETAAKHGEEQVKVSIIIILLNTVLTDVYSWRWLSMWVPPCCAVGRFINRSVSVAGEVGSCRRIVVDGKGTLSLNN